ncbi:MAG: hypothetical protein RLZZ58_1155 [Pseudomonadota bacterium]
MKQLINRLRTGSTGLRRDKRGNTMILMALAMPALVGGTGLAVDVSQWYMWKREMQYAADQAAMSGAYSLSKDDEGDWEDRAGMDITANAEVVDFADDPEIEIADFADGDDNSVLVTLTASRTLPFSGMFMTAPATITVRSQAAIQEASNYTSCLVALDDDAEGAITLGGNGTVGIRCGIAALSTNANAIRVNGQPTVDAGFFVSAGGIDDWIDANTDDEVFENVAGLSDPFEDLEPPTNTTPRTYNCSTTGSGRNRVTSASLQPGTYTSLNTSCNTTLASGVYVINGGSLTIRAQDSFTANGVIFVLKGGARFHINGGASVSMTAPTVSQLAGMGITDERLAGMLIFEDRANSTNQSSIINGNASTILNGKIYMSQSDVTINGTASVTSQCLMIAASTVTITGNGSLGSFCPANTTISEDDSIGGGDARVYLVA